VIAKELYRQSPRFKAGWIAGFYDTKFDDGLRYWNDILRCGVRGEPDRESLRDTGKDDARDSVGATPEPMNQR
jgi:hypothetical protein